MARPKHLNTNGDFNVLDSGYGYWELVYKGKHVIMTSTSRHKLYTKRAVYSSWFSKIVALLKSTGTKLEDL